MPVQTGSEAQPASCSMGPRSFPGLKRQGRGADDPPPSSAVTASGLELYLRLPSVSADAPCGVTFTFLSYTNTEQT